LELLGTARLPLTWQEKVDDDGGAVTLELKGELDRLTAPSLSHQLDQLLAANLNPIVLDVSNVRFMDLGGYRLLVDVGANCARRGCWLVLRRPGLAVRRLVDMIGVPDGVLISSW
jgi:anti-anti-sigma factor